MSPSVAELLGGERVLGAGVITNLDLARATRRGLPPDAASELAKSLSIAATVVQAAAALVDMVSAFGPGSSGNRLTPAESDTVVRMATVLAHAIQVLGDREKAVHWLGAPNKALGGEVPLSLLDTSAGEHEVEALLDRIEYGVYS